MNRCRDLRTCSVLLVVLAGSCGSVQAQLISHEPFDYGAAATLIGSSGGTGWAAAWQSGTGAWTTDLLGMQYVGSVFKSLATSGRRVGTGQGNLGRTMQVASPLGNATGTSWISFLAHHASGPTDQSWLGVSLTSASGANPYLFIGKPWGKPNWGTDAGAVGLHRQAVAPCTRPVLILARIDFRPGLDDVHLWIDPPLAAAAPALATADLALPSYGDFGGITEIEVQCGRTGGVATLGFIDEVRVGDSYASVAPIQGPIVLQGMTFSGTGSGSTGTPIQVNEVHFTLVGTGGGRVVFPDDAGGSVTIGADELPGSGGSMRTNVIAADGATLVSGVISDLGAGGIEHTYDLSAMGAGPLQYELRNDAGGLIASGPLTVPQANFILPNTLEPCEGNWIMAFSIDPATGTACWRLTWFCSRLVAAPQFGGVHGSVNSLTVKSLPGSLPRPVRSFEVHAAGIGGFSLADPEIYRFSSESGFDVIAHGLGDPAHAGALMTPGPGGALAINVGSDSRERNGSGSGMRAVNAAGRSMDLSRVSTDFVLGHLPNAYGEAAIEARGTVEGTADRPIYLQSITGTGDAATMSFDFSPMGASEYIATLYDAAGNVAASGTISNGQAMWVRSIWSVNLYYLRWAAEVNFGRNRAGLLDFAFHAMTLTGGNGGSGGLIFDLPFASGVEAARMTIQVIGGERVEGVSKIRTTGVNLGAPILLGAMTGSVAPVPCYANCDASTVSPVLNIHDFACFLNRFAAGDSAANCDGSTVPPALNVADFACFLNAFAVGCSAP